MSIAVLERAFLVRHRDVIDGLYPAAEPVNLIDAELAHRYEDVRLLELVDAPDPLFMSPADVELRPVLPIDAREIVLFPAARPAAVLKDSRTPEHDPLLVAPEAPTLFQTA
jgi:hypothetical protein